ncbi:MAG: RagB/SusD family nutrient uptake outer membrane protein, partial [Parabacteroides sp.]|nr:RagB/SusD family nutrient uptake outer membrane protein [Parabacteroides sp.]
MKKIKNFIYTMLILLSVTLNSCFDKYLDIVPDNIATIENAFSMRVTAERFLFTCYSWLPNDASFDDAPGLLAGDEFWAIHDGAESYSGNALKIAKGDQGVTNPYLNYWDGAEGGKPLFRAIRECNIFLENVDKIPDIEELDRENWTGEVLFLKAYYHFL